MRQDVYYWEENKREKEAAQHLYPPHVFAECFAVAGAQNFKLDIGVGSIFSELHNTSQPSYMALRKQVWEILEQKTRAFINTPLHKMRAKYALIMFTVKLKVAIAWSSVAQTQHEKEDHSF